MGAFTPELVVGIWVGNDDNTPTRGVTGGSLPAAIWRDFVTRVGPLRSPAPASVPADRAGPAAASASAGPPVAPLRGTARVLDTGTLEIQGQVVRLFVVEGGRGRPARALARYLTDQEAVCDSVPPSGAYRCRIGDHDLSELVLLNGGGQASQEATPELRAIEARARDARIGLWRHWRRVAVPTIGRAD